MRISDWSSDVCSSDLCLGRGVLGTGEHHLRAGVLVVHAKQAVVRIVGAERQTDVADEVVVVAELTHLGGGALLQRSNSGESAKSGSPQRKIGRASCRERGCQYV